VEIGIGLPTTIPGTEGKTLLEWARRAEEAGFSTLGTIGRLVYPNYDDLIALAAAAAVTERIRLTTSILIAPLHANSALLAKQTASLDRLSGGRLVLAVGLGGRDDDYEASGLPTTGRAASWTSVSRSCSGSGAVRSAATPVPSDRHRCARADRS
jgi:alkanesulfonate monooxygenase SsuD/methylene tetrahydromethanopterin reductase-like flavin-dependent oxidoreductase (luciferase family)